VSDDLIKRLRAYNPPDRTVDEQRQISVDIHEAADALEAAQQRIAQFSATPEGGWFEAWRVADVDRQQAQQRIAELERWHDEVFRDRERRGRLAGLRDALEAVLEAVQKKPWLDVGVDKVIQALIDAAEKPSA